MDGVVIDNDRYHIQAWIQICAKYGVELTLQQYQEELNGRTMANCIEILFGDRATDMIQQGFGPEKEALYRHIYQPHIRPTTGLASFLHELQQADIPCALATSAPPSNVGFVLKHTGFQPYFQSIIDDSGVSRGKPDPEIFLTSASRLQAQAYQCIVFEDSLMGIQAARNAKMKVIALATTNPAAKLTHADRVISDFSHIALTDLIEVLATP